MNLKNLLIFHAVITLAAGIVLIFAPPVIPRTVNIEIQHGEYILCYFLATAELAFSYLSFYGRNIKDPCALKLIVITIIIFHLTSLILEVVALSNGVSIKIAANITARAVITGLFYYYGIHKQNKLLKQ